MSLNRFFIIMLGAFLGLLHAQDSPGKTRTPFAYEFNIGGMGALGKTSADYSNSFLIGGGVSLPVTRWVSLDLANMDFGFGTSGGPRTISVSDGSKRSTKNYQTMFTSGGRINLPLGRGAALGLGGGYGAVLQNEYVPSRSYYQGGVRVVENVACSSCSQGTFQGPYVQARLFARSTKHNAFGVTAKYFLANDTDKSFFRSPPQRWLTVAFTFSFGI